MALCVIGNISEPTATIVLSLTLTLVAHVCNSCIIKAKYPGFGVFGTVDIGKTATMTKINYS